MSLTEGLFGKKYSKEEAEEKMRQLENEIEDLNHYVNSDDGTKKDDKRLRKAKKELEKLEKYYKNHFAEKNVVAEDWDDFDEYLTEGLFNKKEKVEIEVIYDDWEAHCTAYKVGDSVHVLKSITIDLPEKFHSNSNNEWDKDLKKGDWEKIFLNHVKKAAKGQFKEYKVVKWFIH